MSENAPPHDESARARRRRTVIGATFHEGRDSASCLVRPAQITDLPGVSSVHATTWRAAYAGIVPASYLAAMSPALSLTRRHELNPDYPLLADGEELVIEVAGVVVGYVSLGRVRDAGMPLDVGEIWALYVLPERQGGGLGSTLLSAGVDRLRALGFQAVVLWVLTGNVRAREFYERRGFVLDGGTKNWEREDWSLPQVRYRLEP